MVVEVLRAYKNEKGHRSVHRDKQIEILPQYRDQLEAEVKDVLLRAIEQNAITELTQTVREREPSSLPLCKLYTWLLIHFTAKRNVNRSRGDVFDHESGKNCKLETITEAERLTSKFQSFIGKPTGDYDLKKKVKKSHMSLDVITDAIHDYVHEKQND